MSFSSLLAALALLIGLTLLQPTLALEIAIHTAEDFIASLNLPGARILRIHEPLNVEGPVIVDADGTGEERLLSILVRSPATHRTAIPYDVSKVYIPVRGSVPLCSEAFLSIYCMLKTEPRVLVNCKLRTGLLPPQIVAFADHVSP